MASPMRTTFLPPSARRPVPAPLSLLLAAACATTHQASANVVCNAAGTTAINFGAVTVNGPGGASATGTIGYTCTNYDSAPVDIYLCVQGGNHVSYPGTPAQPVMQGGTPTLNYNVYTSAAHAVSLEPTNVITAPLHINGGNGQHPANPPTITLYGFFPGNQTSPPGHYTGYLYGNTFGFAASANSTTCSANYSDAHHSYSGQSGISIQIDATVVNACTVSATDVDFGAVAPTATNLARTGTLSVNCPAGTAYSIGLAPSSNSTSGAGHMSGTGTNTDTVPYQLRSGPGPGGAIWGNTATTGSVGNGVAGTGNGLPQTRTVYVTVPGANYRPDSYSDTVTVNVNY